MGLGARLGAWQRDMTAGAETAVVAAIAVVDFKNSRRFIRASGCRFSSGFGFSSPQSACASFATLLQDKNRQTTEITNKFRLIGDFGTKLTHLKPCRPVAYNALVL